MSENLTRRELLERAAALIAATVPGGDPAGEPDVVGYDLNTTLERPAAEVGESLTPRTPIFGQTAYDARLAALDIELLLQPGDAEIAVLVETLGRSPFRGVSLPAHLYGTPFGDELIGRAAARFVQRAPDPDPQLIDGLLTFAERQGRFLKHVLSLLQGELNEGQVQAVREAAQAQAWLSLSVDRLVQLVTPERWKAYEVGVRLPGETQDDDPEPEDAA